jgi:hypothetical protein
MTEYTNKISMAVLKFSIQTSTMFKHNGEERYINAIVCVYKHFLPTFAGLIILLDK